MHDQGAQVRRTTGSNGRFADVVAGAALVTVAMAGASRLLAIAGSKLDDSMDGLFDDGVAPPDAA